MGLTYDYHVDQVIWDGLLRSTLTCNYRDSPREFLMIGTVYVADIDRENTGYIYDRFYRQVFPPHDAEYILSQRGRNWSRD